MNLTHIALSAKIAFVTTLAFAVVGVASYFAFEPMVSRSAEEIFTVSQDITGEISFMASTSAVTMSPSIQGLTGGTGYGTTTSRVLTNNPTGYNMTISFASNTAMYRAHGNGEIPNYLYSTSTTDYPNGFDTSPANAQFGFTVNASTTSEVSSIFTENAGNCGSNNNGTFTVNSCWRGASSTAAATTQLINSTAATPTSGSTTTVQFRVTVPNSPSPAVPTGNYTATATLTATANI